MSLVPFTLSGSLSKANHDTLNKYFGKLIYIFAPTKSYYISLDRHMKRDEVMASLRVVVCYFALFTFAIFYIKKQAFCSSNALYDMEQSQDLQETFIYSSLWSYHRINGIGHRTSRTSLIQLLLLLSGDIETCPGLIDRCGSCLKALKKRQSRMVYSQCHLKFHLKCFCSDDSGVICNSCLFNKNTQDGADQDQQEDAQRYVIPELSELLSKKGLKILHQNIRGLLANKSIICQILDGFRNIHIFSVSETHLSTESEAKVQIEGYTFIAKSRASGQSGGVGVYISSSIPFQRRMDLEQEDIECIWIEILFPKSKSFLVGIIYHPPDSSKHLCANFNCKFESMLLTISAENKECILSGDINCNFLVSSDHKEMKSILTYFGLKQLITSSTRITCESKTLIDVICSNVPHNISLVKVIPAGLSDHELIGCARKLNNVKFNPRIITCRNFANYDPKLFCEELNSANFEEVYSSVSISEAWPSFCDILQQCINKHAPLILKKVKGRLCPRLTPDVKKEINLRDGLLRKARRTYQENDWSSYKRQRNRVSGIVKKCKSRYHHDLLKDCADSPDKFWAAIKKLYPTKSPSDQGSAFVINGLKSTDKSFIANSFCKYFSSIARCLKRKSILLCDFVWSKPAEENLPKQFMESQFTFKAAKESDILKELKNLKQKKASGLDNFPPGLLKDAAYVLTTPLTFIINLSLKTGVVLSEWKVAKVIPLYKSGSLAEIDNYRPISILPTLSKILERIVYKQLMAHLERHSLLLSTNLVSVRTAQRN